MGRPHANVQDIPQDIYASIIFKIFPSDLRKVRYEICMTDTMLTVCEFYMNLKIEILIEDHKFYSLLRLGVFCFLKNIV